MNDFADIWSYLSRDPLIWLTATVAAYLLGDAAFRRSGRSPWVNPVLIAVVLLALLLLATGTRYETYFEGAQFVHFMLGPATVALAVPLRDNLARVRASLVPIAAALIAGSSAAILTALGVASLFGVRGEMLLSIAPKSATTPVAMGVAEVIGGSPTLAAVMVLITGISGAIIVTPLMDAFRVRDWRARGFAAGLGAHGIGLARAFQVNETAGAFAGVAMGLNALLTAALVPLVVGLLGIP